MIIIVEVEHLSTRIEQRLQWRRDKVRELSVKGHNQRQMASILRVGVGSVNEDLQYLRRQAKQNISKYIDEYLPTERFRSSVNDIRLILRPMCYLSMP